MILSQKYSFYDAFKFTSIIILQFNHRQLNGEELQGLTLRELQKLEERLDSSLNRVYKAKVYELWFPSLTLLISGLDTFIFLFILFNRDNMWHVFQVENFIKEIGILKEKVELFFIVKIILCIYFSPGPGYNE